MVDEKPASSVVAAVATRSSLHAVLFGALSGSIGAVIAQPFDVVKTRMQTQNAKGRLLHTARMLFVNDGFFIFWRGLAPSLLRVVPGVGFFFGTLDVVERTSLFQSVASPEIRNFCSGFIARAVPAMFFLPITVVKTRFESHVYAYLTVRSALRDIATVDGIRGLYSGLVPTVLRDGPASALYVACYKKQQSFIPNEFLLTSPYAPFARFTCGFNAAVFACLATHPFDMVKTQMQLYPRTHSSVFLTARYIYLQYGIAGFFRGFVVRTLRRATMAATSWTTFEEILKRIRT